MPVRMMNIIMNRLKKWVHPTQAGMPGMTPDGSEPGYRSTKSRTAGVW